MQAIVERDVRNLARVQALDIMPRLITLAAGQTARLVNIAALSAPFQLSRQTIRDYVTLLQRVFLLEELPPWHSNRLSRLVKTSKLHIGDTGLAACLLGADAAALHEDRPLLGQLLEAAGSAFRAGVVLYDGELGVGFGDRLFAVPINWLWETP